MLAAWALGCKLLQLESKLYSDLARQKLIHSLWALLGREVSPSHAMFFSQAFRLGLWTAQAVEFPVDSTSDFQTLND